MVAGMALTAIGAALIGWRPGLVEDPLTIAALVLLGAGFGFVQSAAMTAVTFTVSRTSMGVALGLFNMMTFAGGTVGLTVFGSLIRRPGPGFTISFALMVMAAIWGIVSALRVISPHLLHDGSS